MMRTFVVSLFLLVNIQAFGQAPADKAEAELTDLLTRLIDPANATKIDYPIWDGSLQYYINDRVYLADIAYESLKDNNDETPSATAKWWKIIPDKDLKQIVITGLELTSMPPEWHSTTLNVYKKIKEKFPKSTSPDGILITGANRIIFKDSKFNILCLQKLSIVHSLSISHCEIGGLFMNEVTAPQIDIHGNSIETIGVDGSTMNHLSIMFWEPPKIMRDEWCSLYLSYSTIRTVSFGDTPDNFSIRLHGCKFPGDTTYYANEANQKNSSVFNIINSTNTVGSLTIFKSEFGSAKDSTSMHLNSNFKRIEIDSSIFNSNLTFSSIVYEKFHITDNIFKGLVSVNNIIFPADVKVRWDELNGRKISKFKQGIVYDPQTGTYRQIEYFKPSYADGISNLDHYEDIMRSYQTLYTYYKNAGDLESANGCFSEMKDVQTERYAYLFSHEKTFKSFFRWKLAQLMKFYTSHGTDPARAIVISMWVMFAFAVFYFFFPSDWDVTSKSKLLSNYKDFIEKNEKGYIKPFFALALGFSVSLLNAFTLSVNSFTTLGFGNIPTHGIAKYFCVLEGFIGWFLLSIFTVALINQVLG